MVPIHLLVLEYTPGPPAVADAVTGKAAVAEDGLYIQMIVIRFDEEVVPGMAGGTEAETGTAREIAIEIETVSSVETETVTVIGIGIGTVIVTGNVTWIDAIGSSAAMSWTVGRSVMIEIGRWTNEGKTILLLGLTLALLESLQWAAPFPYQPLRRRLQLPPTKSRISQVWTYREKRLYPLEFLLQMLVATR